MRTGGSFPSPADGDDAAGRATPVEFEPTRLPSGRGGPLGPRILLVLGLVFVAVALVKPWEGWGPGESGTALASPSASGSPPGSSAAPSPTPVASSSLPRSLLSPPGFAGTDWTRVAAARSPRGAWGISAFLESPDPNGGIRPVYASLEERWAPVRPEPDDPSAGAEASAVVSSDGQPIRALGVTAPPGRTPLDVRIWSLDGDGPPLWLDVRPVDPSVAAGHLYLLPPRTDDGWVDRWSSGTYRVDLLLGSETVRFTLELDDGSRIVDEGSGSPPGPRPTAPAVPAPDVAWLEPGPFVVADGIGMRLSAALMPALSETDTWMALGTDTVMPTVASVWLPVVEGIGIVLPGGATLEWAAFERVVPGPLSSVLASARSFRQQAGGVPTVVFSPSDGGAWAPGTYALDVRWMEDGERIVGRWHVTVLPGPGRRSAAWTVFARAWAPYAGTWGIVTGTAHPRRGGPAATPASHRPQEPGSIPDDPSVPPAGCPGGLPPDPDRPIFGVTHPTDTTLTAVRLEPADAVGRTVPIKSALNAVPGLSIVSPAAGERIEPGAYRLVLETVTGEFALSVCFSDPR